MRPLYKFKEKIETMAPVENELWQSIQENTRVIPVRKNEILVRYNTQSQDIFFVAQGKFVCSQISESGNIQAIWFYFDDVFPFMGCADSIFYNIPTKYELKALEDSLVVKIRQKTIDDWATTYKGFNHFFLQNILKDFVTVFEARSALLTFTSLEFLRYTKQNFPFLFEKLPAHYIADFVGITPEWYSKLQKRL